MHCETLYERNRKIKTVALNYCLKKAENRAGNQKVYNPSPFFYKGKKYDSFVKCCWNYNLEADKVRQKCIAEDISLAEALNYYLIQHPVRRKNDYDSTIAISPLQNSADSTE